MTCNAPQSNYYIVKRIGAKRAVTITCSLSRTHPIKKFMRLRVLPDTKTWADFRREGWRTVILNEQPPKKKVPKSCSTKK